MEFLEHHTGMEKPSGVWVQMVVRAWVVHPRDLGAVSALSMVTERAVFHVSRPEKVPPSE